MTEELIVPVEKIGYEKQAELNWDDFDEIKAGQREESKIIEIKQGKIADFKSPNYFLKNPDIKEEPAIQIICENESKLDIRLPKNKKITPQSNLTRWKKMYQKFPEVGDKVDTVVDENGFRKIVLG